jgi:iron uptake system component EfeO
MNPCRRIPWLIAIPVAAAGIGSATAVPERTTAQLDAEIESYRSALVEDVDRTLASAQKLRASAVAGDIATAKQAWFEARVGWERSEVFTTGFVPELDRDIDAWPNGVAGFHAIEAKLFGANSTDFGKLADELVHNLSELGVKARSITLTPQGLLNGTVRLAYEVGESKVDGGESRVSGTSLDDMRNNVDGIELAWRTIFAPAVEAHDAQLAADVRKSIDTLKAIVEVRDLKRIDPDSLRAVSEGLVVMLQNTAPLLHLKKPTLEGDAQ